MCAYLPKRRALRPRVIGVVQASLEKSAEERTCSLCFDSFPGSEAREYMTAMEACGNATAAAWSSSAVLCKNTCAHVFGQLIMDASTGHLFCNDCWRRHLKVQIEDEGQAAQIHCAGHQVVRLHINSNSPPTANRY